jgi:hypothetical protein
VKIVYTNLKEDDSGVVRSVRQLRFDFSKPADRNSTRPESKSPAEGRRRHLSLVSRSAADERAGEQDGVMNGFADLNKSAPGKSRLIPTRTAGSLSAFFINKFIASESLGTADGNIGSIVNISV